MIIKGQCNRKKIVVGISTGHVGTTSLSDSENFVDGACSLSDFVFHFEEGGEMANMRFKRAGGLKDWYNSVKGGSTETAENRLVHDMKKNWCGIDPLLVTNVC